MLHRLGLSAMLCGATSTGRDELVDESDEIHRRTREHLGPGTDHRLTRRDRARSRVTSALRSTSSAQSASLAREVDVIWWESGALAELACLSLNAGLVDEGDEHARAALAIAE